MKKNLLFLAALSVVALPFLFSCGKTDPEKPDEVIVMQDPPTKDAAKVVVFPANNPPKYVDKGVKYDIIQIEFTESNRYILQRRFATKANDDIETIIGSYTESNGSYNCQGFGSVNVSGSGSSANVDVKPEGTENQGEEYQYSGAATVTDTPAPTSQDEKNAVRNWKIDNMSLVVSGKAQFERGFTGCNLFEIATYAQVHGGVNIDAEKFRGYNVVEFSFTGNDTFIIRFENSSVIKGTFSMTESSKTINLSLPEGNEFFSGSISGSYSYPADKKMNLTLNASIKGYSGRMDFFMSQTN